MSYRQIYKSLTTLWSVCLFLSIHKSVRSVLIYTLSIFSQYPNKKIIGYIE